MSHENENNQTMISELSDRILNGVIKENPTFVLLLGMCPTLAVTTSAINGLGMGATTLVVLALSNLFISLLRKVIPNKIRIPAFIVIIASFVTMVELLLEAYIPTLYDALGLYIPLIVVNCIILGRAESYAYSHKALPSLFDGIGMGMGFTLALTIIGAFREVLGSGKIFAHQVMPSGFIPVSIFVMAPGAFFVLAMLTAIQNVIKANGEKKGKDMSKIQSGCGGNCMDCSKECKVSLTDANIEASTEDLKEEVKEEAKEEIKPEVKEEIKEAVKEEAEVSKEENSDEETKTEDKASEEDLPVKEDTSEDALEILDIFPIKKEETVPVKKPRVRRASLEKAQAMLSKAEETLKEENHD